MFLVLLLFTIVAILTVLGTHRSTTAERATFLRRIDPAAESVPAHANSTGHYRAKTVEVRQGSFRVAMEAPHASCRKIADRFNLDHLDVGLSVGKTYVAEFLRDFKQWRAAPKGLEHSINTACAVNHVWAIDITEHCVESQTTPSLLGILYHVSRCMLTFHALHVRSSITILRLVLDAIEHYGKPKVHLALYPPTRAIPT